MQRTILNTLSILNKTERKRFWLLALLNVLVNILDIASLAVLVFMITLYSGSNFYLADARYSKWFSIENYSFVPALVFLIFILLKNILAYFLLSIQNKYAYKIASRISYDMLLKYFNGAYPDQVRTNSSVYERKILHEPIEFCHYILSGIQQMFSELILILLSIAGILIFNYKMFLFIVIALLPPLLLITYLFRKHLENARQNIKTDNEKTIQYLNEALAGYIESKIYNKKLFFSWRFLKHQSKMTRHLSDLYTTSALPSRIMEVFLVLGLFLIVLANKLLTNVASLEIVNIGALMAGAYKIIPGVVKLSNLSAQLKTYGYTVEDLVKSNEEKDSTPGTVSGHIRSILFKNVNFSHGKDEMLDNVNMELMQGDFAGISGNSGKGKTTCINMLLGFFEADSGEIVINDITTNAAERSQYHNNIAYTQQRPFLINDTILNNITLGDEVVNKDKLDEAIKISGLKLFTDTTSEQLNMMVAENGKNISGGQRQQIAIARALYKDADVLILDEPFSELDDERQLYILDGLKKWGKNGKIIIMITHNKDNFSYCNKTYFIE